MELNELAAIAGKPGLYRIIKPARASIIVETLDSQKKRLVISANQRVSVLDEISVYTNNSQGSIPLIDVLKTIYHEFGEEAAIEKDADNAEYLSFFKAILPEFDEEKVYASDIKKIVRWYYILMDQAPQLISTDSDEEE